MLCDTEGGAVLLLDRALRLEARIAVSAPWIQDAVLHGERLLVVANRRIITRTLPAPEQASAGRDVLDNYVLEVGDGVPRKKLCLGGDNRIYMVEPITAAAAEGLAHAWRSRPFDMPWLRWDLRPATAESPTATHDRPRGSGC